MSVINTNINALTGLSNLRKTNLGIRNSLEKLSSGFQINKAADDPAGLAIVTGMQAQIGGIRMAVQNAEDSINLIQTADGALIETGEILQRMRDLAVRAANQAPLNGQDRLKLQQEFLSLRDELNRKSAAITFNTKQLFVRDFAAGMPPELSKYVTATANAFSTQVGQVGPDNGTQYRMDITINSLDTSGLGLGTATSTPLETFAYTQYSTHAAKMSAGFIRLIGGDTTGTGGHNNALSTGVGNAQRAITAVDNAINQVARLRSTLGVQQRRLNHIINDLTAQDINISASKSRILDANMAVEITNFTKMQILQQSGTAILAQANAQPQSVLQLLQ